MQNDQQVLEEGDVTIFGSELYMPGKIQHLRSEKPWQMGVKQDSRLSDSVKILEVLTAINPNYEKPLSNGQKSEEEVMRFFKQRLKK